MKGSIKYVFLVANMGTGQNNAPSYRRNKRITKKVGLPEGQPPVSVVRILKEIKGKKSKT
ncbi:uncharacterized protein DS421_13g404010 [Arachis hypogaea]|nr:uncharacterized protein DS421_13g404010 [Arachis hypogaea]